MIILDLSESTKKPPSIWPPNMPVKIRLTKGSHEKDYDLHPMVRNTKWYKQLKENIKRESPYKRDDWPVGIDLWTLPGSAKIMDDFNQIHGNIIWNGWAVYENE